MYTYFNVYTYFEMYEKTNYTLIVTVRKHPTIILREEYQDPKSFRYVVDLNQAESPVWPQLTPIWPQMTLTQIILSDPILLSKLVFHCSCSFSSFDIIESHKNDESYIWVIIRVIPCQQLQSLQCLTVPHQYHTSTMLSISYSIHCDNRYANS